MTTAHDAHAEEHDLGHHGSPWVQHHYDDAQHQFDSGKFGIWLFLAQEVLFFSALFVAYILYRVHHPEIYAYAHKWLDVTMGAINTAVLIFSSLTAAWAVRCAQLNQRRGLIVCLTLTLMCACAFLVIKYFEYTHKHHEQIMFGRYFDPCISSGENELITKSNDCPGAKSTVVWSTKADGSLDRDSTGKAMEGCFESSLLDLDTKEPGVQAECDVNEVKLSGDGKTELSRKPITNVCADRIGHHSKQYEQNKYPCWKPSYQPAVCPDLTDAVKRSQGAAARPQVGILVLYGDHEHRGKEIAIKAECKKPPPPQPPADLLAAPEHKVELGKGLVAETKVEHNEHDVFYAGPPPEHTNMFFTIYFAMTGLHGIHVLMGVFVFIWLLIRAIKGHFTPDYFGPVDYAALYWHIVDLIWIFLFPLLYLIV
jgi:cytochrome c oxidase subunit III